MRPNTQHITKALLVMALLSIFSFALAQTPVSNILDLWNVRNALNGTFVQTADIDLSATNPDNLAVWATGADYAVGDIKIYSDNGFVYYCFKAEGSGSGTSPGAGTWTNMWEASKGWQPIGYQTSTEYSNAFTGVYDGANFEIKNLYIKRGAAVVVPANNNVEPSGGEGNVGLFGFVSAGTGSNTEIKNVHLISPKVTGKRGTGSLVGKVLLPNTSGKTTVIISNCSASGTDATVSGFGATGGLVGANNSDRKQRVPIVRYCSTDVSVSSTHPTNVTTNPNDYFGSPRKYNPYNIKYGGVVGCNENGVTSDSYSWGSVFGGDRVGGVAGCTINGAIIRCYAIGKLTQGISSPNWEGGIGGITGRTGGSLPPGLGGAESNGSVDYSYYPDNMDITRIGGGIPYIGNTSGPMDSTIMKDYPITVTGLYVNWDTTVWQFNNGYWPIFTGTSLTPYFYRTMASASGNWSDKATWQSRPTQTSSWDPATSYPDFSNSQGVTINHSIIADIDVSIDQLSVFTAGILSIPSGKTLTLVNGEDTDLSSIGTIIVDGTMIVDQGSTFIQKATFTINGHFINSGSTSWISGTVSAATGSTITYNGVTAQSTGDNFPSSIHHMVIDNITEPDTNAKFTFTNAIIINGTLTVTRGTVIGSPSVHGYSSPALNFLEIAEDGELISSFSATTSSDPDHYPVRIERQWKVTGNIPDDSPAIREKTLTFTWSAAEDNNFNWDMDDLDPTRTATLFADSATTGISGDLTILQDGTRKLVVTYPFSKTLASPVFSIGRQDNQTLPVELSSFTAQPHQGNSVMIQWRTQSETNVLGFSIYRGLDEDLAAALRLDITIPATNTSQAKTYVYYDREVQTGHYYYWLESIDFDGDSQLFGPVNIHLDGNDPGSPDVAPIPGFKDIYPNPFNPEATIRYGVDKAGSVDIKIYNYRGQLVRNLVDTQKSKGWHQAIWDGNNDQGIKVTSGVYFARMNMNGKQYMRKMVMMK